MKIQNTISLEEHEARAKSMIDHKHNGIACPVCQHVLYDDNFIPFLTNPPTLQIACTNGECTYTGNRLV